MSYLNTTRTKVSSDIATHEGGVGRKADAREELAVTALTTFLGDRFYETAEDTLVRMYDLAQRVPATFLTQLARVARQEFNMRATPAALVGFHLLEHGQPEDYRVIRDVYLRGDELGDTLATVARLSDKRKVTPSAVRFARNVLHDRLTERNALRYSGSNREWSLAKIIRLSHARQDASARQVALYNFILRWHDEGSLTKAWASTPEEERALIDTVRKAVNGEDVGEISWERSRTAGADWKALVNQMGYMALLRNLRNFMEDDSLTTDTDFWNYVCNRLADPEEVAKSRQLPFRFLAAYNALPRGHRQYGRVSQAVSDALDASVGNLPAFEGRTLVVVDTSGSMDATTSDKSEIRYVDIGALFGAAMFQSQDADVVAFGTNAAKIPLKKTGSILANRDAILAPRDRLGYGTNLSIAFGQVNVADYSNIVVFSDMQIHDGIKSALRGYTGNVYSVNLAGYEAQLQRVGGNFYALAGWSDATLKLMALVSTGGLVSYIETY